MGLNGYKRLLKERETMLETFPIMLRKIASKHGERILSCPGNTISFGITLDGLARQKRNDESDKEYTTSIAKEISSFGAMLFSRCVSGTRVVPRGEVKTMGGHEFLGFGSSTTNFSHAYMTAACAIGVSTEELDEFFARLDKTLSQFASKKKKRVSKVQ
jgi:O-phospho-L-seryl-tRNASec:L-selenocysteinyl-tRNA synthase